ncbi:MAG: hypothetical protein WAQ22_00610 [Candidatus Saccharimonas sp.]
MNDIKVRQQIVEKLKESSNILVTVSANPTVDELSAALGLTLFLNKLDKHATAVFSGDIPPAIKFLNPEKTFENTVDSLRDFIIALDKEKADHLRYKVVDDMVKIFITPYRTTIGQEDLEFSQGDYNVEFVLTIGVKSEEELDHALESHGRILHDAPVASLSIDEAGALGSMNWTDTNASSYSEMSANLADSLSGDKKLVDKQIATAFLTGIVAATERFSNEKTSSRVMTIAAQLMAAGADQQLIATQLQEAQTVEEAPQVADDDHATNDTVKMTEGETSKIDRSAKTKETSPEPIKKKTDDGALVISHHLEGDADEVAQKVAEKNQQTAAELAEAELAKQTAKNQEDQQEAATKKAEDELAAQIATVTEKPVDFASDLAAEAAQPVVEQPKLKGAVSDEIWKKQVSENGDEPSLGGTLNATTEQAAEEARRALDDDRNKMILSHDGDKYIEGEPTMQAPFSSASVPHEDEPSVPDVSTGVAPTVRVDDIQPPQPVVGPTLEELDKQHRAAPQASEAMNAVNAAYNSVPSQPTAAPAAPSVPGTPPLPPLPPMPDFSTLPPLPPSMQQQNSAPLPAPIENAPASISQDQSVVAPSNESDPAQFHIPGQS